MDFSQFLDYITPDLILPLTLYSFGMAVYAIIIWKFYRFLARRDIIKFQAEKYSEEGRPTFKGFFGFMAYVINYIILVPISSFIWFAVLSTFLLFMAKEQPINQILLISMSIIAATRITAYYHEDLSKDLAKILPFALLGIFVVNPTFFSLDLVVERFKELPTFFTSILTYIVFAVALEFILKILHIIGLLFGIGAKE
ncbi:hypothetical protein KY345_05920 [Candidatus Woesearchaeota archaeon]|nr:hypothetical protein [Candidatus Woesearchaeota archaeon]